MDDISIKILDALFDLVDGENYVIVEKSDITSRISDYVFETDEITEILESLSADGLIDLKYADNEEFCVAMKTKGRALIRQSRDRLQKLIDADSAAIQRENIVIESALSSREEDRSISFAEEDKPSVEPARDESPERPANREELLRVHREMRRERERMMAETESARREGAPREYSTAPLSRGYAVHVSTEGEEKKSPRADKRSFLYGFLGAAAGALLINVIFLIIFLVKFAK